MDEITRDRRPFEHLESIDDVLSIAASMESLNASIGTVFRIHAIVDTNILVADLRYMASRQKHVNARPAILELLAKKTIVGYFPLEKLGELDAKCLELSDRYSIPAKALSQLWSRYKQLLHIVPTATLERDRSDSQALAVRDPTDLPFVQARHIVGASVVLTNDPDIQAAGAPVLPWSRVLVDLREHERKRTVQVAILLGTGTAIIVPLAAIVGCVRLMCHAWHKVPRELIIAAAVGLGIALLIPESRAFLVKSGKAVMDGFKALGSVAGPALGDACGAAAEAKAHADRMHPMLDKELRKALAQRITLKQAVYRACLLASRPMTVVEIWTAAVREGVKFRARDPLRSVLVALKRHPLIAALPDGRWQVCLGTGQTTAA